MYVIFIIISGYLVGALCAVSGVLFLAFTVPSAVNNFLLFYNYVQYAKEGETKTDDNKHIENKNDITVTVTDTNANVNSEKIGRQHDTLAVSADKISISTIKSAKST